jgi:LuxR family maltose regulon positive regulatory protein
LLLEAIADDAPGDSGASILDLARDLGLAEPDRGPASGEPARLGEPGWPGGQARPGGPLTEGETRVLRYLPTHMSAAQIAAELYLSANTVRTHLRHLYRKLGAHSRQEAVQRARVIGLLTGSCRRP